MHLHKNLEEKNMLAFLVTLIKVIAPWVAAAVVIHYLNVYNEKKYPEFYNLDDKKTPQSLFENLEIGYPFELAFIMYVGLLFFLICLIGAYVDDQLNWFTGGIFGCLELLAICSVLGTHVWKIWVKSEKIIYRSYIGIKHYYTFADITRITERLDGGYEFYSGKKKLFRIDNNLSDGAILAGMLQAKKIPCDKAGMTIDKFTLKTRSEVEDIVISTLADVGIEGVEIQDKQPLSEQDKKQMFVDILPDMPEDDGVAYLNFYLDEDEDVNAMLEKVKAELEELRMFVDIGSGMITLSQTEDKDWINNWKQYFKQFYVDDILIIPSWEEVKEEDKDRMIIHIDPGTAFGTGMHETTQLCIRQIRKYTTETTKILDVGCGSGILGMLALKFGAEHSVGTDLDSCAIDATYENMENNGISGDKYEVMIGNIINDKEVQDKVGYECYDIVAANILAPVLVELTPVIVNQLKPGGIYITSGIIDDKEEMVKEAVAKAGLELLDVTYQGEWVCVTARKNA